MGVNQPGGWIRWYRRITFGRGFADDDFADVAYACLASALGNGRPALVDVVTEAWQTPIGAHRSAVAQGATAGYGG